MAEIDLHLAFDYMVENLNANMIMVDRDDIPNDHIEENVIVRKILGHYAAQELTAFQALDLFERYYRRQIGFRVAEDNFADAWD